MSELDNSRFNDEVVPETPKIPESEEEVTAFITSVLESISDEPVADESPTQRIATQYIDTPEYTRQIQSFDERPERKQKQKKQRRHRLPAALRAVLYLLFVVLFSFLLAIFAWNCALDVLALTKPDREVTITISDTDSIEDVTQKLYDNQLIDYPWLFRIYCKYSHAERKIDPGVYTLNNLFDYHALVNGMIATAETHDSAKVTIPEGFECRQIFKLLEEKQICSYEELADCAANHEFDYEFLKDLPYGSPNRLEGYLFPDTYEFYLDDDPVNVLRKFLNNFERKYNRLMEEGSLEDLNASLRTKMEANGFTEEQISAGMITPYKLIVVASIIEKETAGASESGKIASVIYNRLCSNLYPLLQIDATVQYILDERKEILSQDDLAIDSPFNTYRNPGLTPAPISNPGLESMRAALIPEVTDYYFYALAKNGWHHFSSSYFDHQAFLEGLNNEN